jgi:hypothetical protein
VHHSEDIEPPQAVLLPVQEVTAPVVPPPVASQPPVTTNDEPDMPIQTHLNTVAPPIPPVVQVPAQEQHVSVTSSNPALQAFRPTFNAQLQALQDQVESLTRMLQTPAHPPQAPPAPDIMDDEVGSIHMDERGEAPPPLQQHRQLYFYDDEEAPPPARTTAIKSSAAIVKEINKCMHKHPVKQLEFTTHIDRRQHAFQYWVRQVHNILNNVPELDAILVDFPEIGTAATPNASQALYSFILLTVDKAYYDIIEAYNKETQSYSGKSIIRHLQTVCLSQNAQLQKKAKREFETLTIDKNQSLIVFNKQFNSLKATYLERGGVLTNEEAIVMYFDAIAMIDNAHINGSILFMKQQFQLDPSQFALHQVHSDLQMIEEQIITQRKREVDNNPKGKL